MAGDAVYVVTGSPARRPEGGMAHQVWSLAAIRGVGSLYEYVPTGRLDELAPIDGDAELLGLAATSDGPVAMLKQPGREGGGGDGVAMLMLSGQKWEAVDVPWELGARCCPASDLAVMAWVWRSPRWL